MDEELEAFKTAINLSEYAASQGYAIDRKESWRGSVVMRHASGDKVIIARDRRDGHWVYFSVRDEADNGSVIDFLQNRKGLNLGEVRKALRLWVGKGPFPARPPEASYAREVEPTSKDRARVAAEFERMKPLRFHPYLESERKLPRSVLVDPRFAGRIRIDGRGNAVFPHFDAEGLCGYELKNRDFTGFSRGGEKGLWLSQKSSEDVRLVFSESAIDALSYCVLDLDGCTRYASIGGQMNPKQPELIRAAAAGMPAGSEIVAAMDADEEGRRLAGVVERAAALTGRLDLRFRRHEPSQGKDWNELLQRGESGPFPFPTAQS